LPGDPATWERWNSRACARRSVPLAGPVRDTCLAPGTAGVVRLGASVSTARLRSILVLSEPAAPAGPVPISVPELAVLSLGYG
jgi:hypothetical protein